MVFLLGVWGWVKDAGVVGPRAEAVTVILGARLGSGGKEDDSDVRTSSRPIPAPGGRKLEKTHVGMGGCTPVSSSAAAAAGELEYDVQPLPDLPYSTVLPHQPGTRLEPGSHDSASSCSWMHGGIPLHRQVPHSRV